MSRFARIAGWFPFALWLCCAPVSARTGMTLVDFGRALFFDTDLSATRNQSCASCHDPQAGFADSRRAAAAGAVSLGDDGRSRGTRNTPAIAYAALVPPFAADKDGYIGGLFLDGRAGSLEAQAAEPFVNPLEMAMPDTQAVVDRVLSKPNYVAALENHFGARVLDDPTETFAAITHAIARFERSPALPAFDSRYDRFLRGEIELDNEAELGRRLFFSDLTNCMQCHLLETTHATEHEPFSNQRYHNIGIPANPALELDAPDGGLGDRADIKDPAARGRFRTPSLRNVAVTGPYMHNGVFQELETAIRFYNRYLVNNAVVGTNPETGKPWGPSEVAENIDRERLELGQPLSDAHIRHLIAFLRSLTDRRFEHLLPVLEPAPEH